MCISNEANKNRINNRLNEVSTIYKTVLRVRKQLVCTAVNKTISESVRFIPVRHNWCATVVWTIVYLILDFNNYYFKYYNM